jgi:hypothetical protein
VAKGQSEASVINALNKFAETAKPEGKEAEGKEGKKVEGKEAPSEVDVTKKPVVEGKV